MNINELIRPCVRELRPYQSARGTVKRTEGLIFLDANENPFENGYNRYPDPNQNALKRIIADQRGVALTNIVIGNGSDEVLDLIVRAFCEPGQDEIAILTPTYGMYEVLAGINNVAIRDIPLNEDFSLNEVRIREAINPNTKILFICNPNNPTGTIIKKSDIESLLTWFDGLLVVDEAYIEFSDEPSMIASVKDFENVFVVQTLSKAWAAAGLRIGIGIGNEAVVNTLMKIKPPYNVSQVAQIEAVRVLEDSERCERNRLIIIEERNKLMDYLSMYPGVSATTPSKTNFILAHFEKPDETFNYLLQANIIVRNRSKIRGCEGCLRISIGTPEENKRLMNALEKFNNEKESLIY